MFANWIVGFAVLSNSVHSSPLFLRPGKVVPTSGLSLNNTSTLYSALLRQATLGEHVTHHSNSKRTHHDPISQKQWDDAVNKGCNLLGAMSVEDKQAATFFANTKGTCQSEFTNSPEDFEKWGYTPDEESLFFFRQGGGPDLDKFLDGLKIDRTPDSKGGPMVPTAWKHTKTTENDGLEYEPTEANYATIFNVDQGLIIAWKKFGPQYMGLQQNPPVTTLPKLKNWSDIAFLNWKRIAEERKKDASGLKYIISAGIVNGETISMLQRAFGVEDFDEKCADYERARPFAMAMPEAKALLSSPNGRGAALLLIQHKAVFGDKRTIKTVWFWCSGFEGYWDLNLMFEVEDIK